jgi:hypothetical protein
VTGRDRDEPWKHRNAWEYVDAGRVANTYVRTERLAVPNGWIYKITEYWDDERFAVAVCFVPDH